MVNQYRAHSFARNWQVPFLNQRKGENYRRKYSMINLHERNLPTSAGVEPATSWSPFGRASNWATEAGQLCCWGNCNIILARLTLSMLGKNKTTADDISSWSSFLIFPENRLWYFMQFAWNNKAYYLGKIWKMSPVCGLVNLPIDSGKD